MSTYLQLVNSAMSEAKVSLDPLTSADFANPPRTQLYNKFKDWVARAYKELILRRKEWKFRTERSILTVYPRLHLTGVASVPAVGAVISGRNSLVQAQVIAVHTHEDIESDSITEVTLSLSVLNNKQVTDFVVSELIDVISPTAATGIATVKGLGTYDLRSQVTNLAEVDEHSVRVHESAEKKNTSFTLLQYLPWDNVGNYPGLATNTSGTPQFVTITPEGNLQFYPHLNRPYVISFNFTRKVPTLVNAADIPSEIPEEYHDYLMWKAVADYADYDSNQRVFARASKNLELYQYWLERDHLEDPYFGPNRFYTGS